jgi:hypothetical protein
MTTDNVVRVDFVDPIALLAEDDALSHAIAVSDHPACRRFERWLNHEVMPLLFRGKMYHWPHGGAALQRMIREAIDGAKPYQLQFDFGDDYEHGCSPELAAQLALEEDDE